MIVRITAYLMQFNCPAHKWMEGVRAIQLMLLELRSIWHSMIFMVSVALWGWVAEEEAASSVRKGSCQADKPQKQGHTIKATHLSVNNNSNSG